MKVSSFGMEAEDVVSIERRKSMIGYDRFAVTAKCQPASISGVRSMGRFKSPDCKQRITGLVGGLVCSRGHLVGDAGLLK